MFDAFREELKESRAIGRELPPRTYASRVHTTHEITKLRKRPNANNIVNR